MKRHFFLLIYDVSFAINPGETVRENAVELRKARDRFLEIYFSTREHALNVLNAPHKYRKCDIVRILTYDRVPRFTENYKCVRVHRAFISRKKKHETCKIKTDMYKMKKVINKYMYVKSLARSREKNGWKEKEQLKRERQLYY